MYNDTFPKSRYHSSSGSWKDGVVLLEVKLEFILRPKYIADSNNKFHWNSLSSYGDETCPLKGTSSLWRVTCTRWLQGKYPDAERGYAADFSFATECILAGYDFVILRLREFVYIATDRFD
jgi:hypothetical protein